ncbi:2-acylglycerol O-acyltransferase 1 [Octodon degus]|uniref:Acyltransferase n=1 Tax=Octodon degus TaxID=10160 RepID=A0A6P6F379_OCTDE|nr:2-acylglycerol O-acyltransferase 1 [Octodon degus]
MKAWLGLLRVLVEQLLQSIMVLHVVFLFVVFGVENIQGHKCHKEPTTVPLPAPSSLAISIIVIVYNYWFIYLPYLTWLYFDWLTPDKGGRRSSWVRNWNLWKYCQDYFPLRLVKTHNLDPRHNYIFGLHPHGILALGTAGNINFRDTDFATLFPGFTIYLHVTSCWFLFPLLREYMLSIGTVSVSKKSLSYILSKDGGGNISAIIIGGAKEVLDCHPGKFIMFIRERKGFVKLALTHGAHLVPVFAFGENDLYNQVENPEGSWLRAVQERLQRILTFAVPLFYGRGFFQHRFGLLPHRRPVHSVVGRPIPVQKTPNPTQEQVEALHQTYMDELTKLFDEHKGKYGIAEHETLILR